jgi:hypothetical protein
MLKAAIQFLFIGICAVLIGGALGVVCLVFASVVGGL